MSHKADGLANNPEQNSDSEDFISKLERLRKEQPYITLQSVLDAIAQGIDIPQSELNQYRWPPLVNISSSDIDSMPDLYPSTLPSFLNYSRAARTLHLLIAEEAPEAKCYDFNHESTNIVATIDAKNRCLNLLAEIAGAERKFSNEWYKAVERFRYAIQFSFDHTSIHAPNSQLMIPTEAEQIGFKFDNITDLLSKHKVQCIAPQKDPFFPNWHTYLEPDTIQSKTKTPDNKSETKKSLPDGVSCYPNSKEIADAFAGILGKNRRQWATMLKSPPHWLNPARIERGRRGVKGGATWDPLIIAQSLIGGVKIELPKESSSRYNDNMQVTPKQLEKIFTSHLRCWEDAWKKLALDLDSYL
ncbi:hypothetical protein [Dechloromonas sp. ZS-1]|uniref:hypothetical protein n=1 Tax=Dechloromonas sp. ZS-1 TaxID=3138067 RepID=UPI0031FDBB6D